MLVNFEKLWFDLKNFFFISSTIHDLFKDKSATFNLFFSRWGSREGPKIQSTLEIATEGQNNC